MSWSAMLKYGVAKGICINYKTKKKITGENYVVCSTCFVLQHQVSNYAPQFINKL